MSTTEARKVSQTRSILGESDAIRSRVDDEDKLEDEIVAVVEVKPELLMVTLVPGMEPK